MRVMRRLVALSTLAAFLALATSARAGGAVWEFEGYHRPGEVVVSTTAVAWGHRSALGTPEDGPYLIFLAPANAEVDNWPDLPEESMLVGIVEVHEGPYTHPEGYLYGPNHAVARFEIPDVAPGVYQIFHCNDPCTATLGDLVGGWDLRVMGGEAGRPATEIAAEVRDRMTDAPLLIPAEPHDTEAERDHTATVPVVDEVPMVEEPSSAPADVVRATGVRAVSSDPTPEPGASEERGPVPAAIDDTERFDGLWMLVVALVSALLAVRLAYADSVWHRESRTGQRTGSQSRMVTRASIDE